MDGLFSTNSPLLLRYCHYVSWQDWK